MSQQHANLLSNPLEKIRFQSFRIHIDNKKSFTSMTILINLKHGIMLIVILVVHIKF
jgi:hypothetical protein